MSSESINRKSDQAELDERSDDDAKMRKILDASLKATAMNLQHETKEYLKKRKHWIDHACLLLANGGAHVQKKTVRDGPWFRTTHDLLLPGEDPEPGTSLMNFSTAMEVFSNKAGFLSQAHPDLKAYFNEEKGQLEIYQT